VTPRPDAEAGDQGHQGELKQRLRS
jgi:hypothetical protein